MRGWIQNFKIVLALEAAVASNPSFAAEVEAPEEYLECL